jgi:hypothetical protein
MKFHRLAVFVLFAIGAISCGGMSSDPGSPPVQTADAGQDATEDVTTKDVTTEDATIKDVLFMDILADACPTPAVQHGAACSTEGAAACGAKRTCSDVLLLEATTCICKGGRYDCGSCRRCDMPLRASGCGFGQVCDGVTFTRCDGTTFEVSSTCTCRYGQDWVCADAGTFELGLCGDAKLEASPDAPDTGTEASANAPETGAEASTDASDASSSD